MRGTTPAALKILALVALIALAAACGDDTDADRGAGGDTTSATPPVPDAQAGERVGAEGGVIGLDIAGSTTAASAGEDDSLGAGQDRTRPPQVELEIPPGALDEDVDITISAYSSAPDSRARPDGYRIASRIFEFAPEGLTFNEPITVRMRYSGSPEGLGVYWTEFGSRSVFAEVEGATLQGGVATAQVTHFSRGFVGTTCTAQCSGLECGPDGCGGLCGTCPGGERCDAGRCVELGTTTDVTSLSCESNADCRAGEECLGGRCSPTGTVSTADADTTPSTTTAAWFECNIDADCAAGEVCSAGLCVPQGTASQAPATTTPGLPSETPTCSSNDDCNEGETCAGGLCVPDTNATCASNADCQASEVCVAGFCEPEDEGSSCEVRNACGGCEPLGGNIGDTCGICENGMLQCAGQEALVCEGEVDLQSDPQNCGSCGVACAMGEVCIAGACMTE